MSTPLRNSVLLSVVNKSQMKLGLTYRKIMNLRVSWHFIGVGLNRNCRSFRILLIYRFTPKLGSRQTECWDIYRFHMSETLSRLRFYKPDTLELVQWDRETLSKRRRHFYSNFTDVCYNSTLDLHSHVVTNHVWHASIPFQPVTLSPEVLVCLISHFFTKRHCVLFELH